MTLPTEELITDTSDFLILGSTSVARKELLVSVGLVPDRIEAPGVDESFKKSETPRDYVKRIAVEKANSISSNDRSFLITADTIVTLGRRILLKTSNELKAFDIYVYYPGRHSVFTAFCVKNNGLVRLYSVKTS